MDAASHARGARDTEIGVAMHADQESEAGRQADVRPAALAFISNTNREEDRSAPRMLKDANGLVTVRMYVHQDAASVRRDVRGDHSEKRVK